MANDSIVSLINYMRKYIDVSSSEERIVDWFTSMFPDYELLIHVDRLYDNVEYVISKRKSVWNVSFNPSDTTNKVLLSGTIKLPENVSDVCNHLYEVMCTHLRIHTDTTDSTSDTTPINTIHTNNCPNCGAKITPETRQCEYCDTIFYI